MKLPVAAGTETPNRPPEPNQPHLPCPAFDWCQLGPDTGLQGESVHRKLPCGFHEPNQSDHNERF